jgi:serine/threonine-protein kinase
MTTPTSPDVFPTGGESLPVSLLERLSERFVLQREIGRGGMAMVWLGHRRGEERPIAVKVMRPTMAETIATQRFLREIRIASAVRSPALVPLDESGEIDGLPYYVMPFAEGGSLRDWLRRERHLRIEDAIRVGQAVATALAALHRDGFVHRDIKPENVLVASDGAILLADYGIAHALTASAKAHDLTTSGVVLGTPPYMSPEQAVGEAVDGRSDIYSLGCLLYEALAGEPPFHGATAQAVLARHMHEQPPSLRVVRPTVPEALEAVIMRMLSKVPADRFTSAEEVTAALEKIDLRDTGSRRIGRWRHRNRTIAAAAIGIAAVAATVYLAVARRAQLDADRVIVFPFAGAGATVDPEWAQLPMLVGSALDRTATTKWLDGYSLLDPSERAVSAALDAARLREIARRAGARYYLDGSVSRGRDSLSVQVRLHDASSGRLVDTKSAAGVAVASAGELVLKAVVRLLPRLTGLDRVVDVSDLTDHPPAAIDNWLRGERAYRESRMADALRYCESALAIDSLLVPAAFRAAAAASWTIKPERAVSYIRLALRHQEQIPARQRAFALALERYLAGRANEAFEQLRPALQRETETADAWMLAGEIQMHLLPTVGVDSLPPTATFPPPTTWPDETFAQEALVRARTLDGDFSPPLAHLAEIAARRGDADGLARYARLLERANPDSLLGKRMSLMERCVRNGAPSIDWRKTAQTDAATLYQVGVNLRAASDLGARACAASAFQALLSADTTQGVEDWGSLIALHGMLAAEGQNARALSLVDSAVAGGLPSAVGLYVLDAVSGMDIGNRADAFIAQLLGNLETRGAPSLWLLTLWSARTNDSISLARINGMLMERAARSGQRLDSLIARVSAAYLARARADSSLALRLFAELQPTADHRQLEGSLWESLATERLAHAELLLARGQPATAHRVASTFDQPSILIHELFLRRSLELRQRAARSLSDATLERRAAARLSSLQHTK